MFLQKSFNSIFLLAVFTLFSICFAHAQEEKAKSSLKQILIGLENLYDISFTYADENIKDLYIKAPPGHLSLEQAIDYLHKQTDLKFEILDERFVAIYLQNKEFINLCGYIKDEITQEDLQGVTISSGNKITTTDKSGFFSLSHISTSALIEFRSVGYKIKVIEIAIVDTSSCVEVYLQPETMTLSEVTITNYLTEGIDKRLDGAIRVSGDNLGILPGLIEPDVLQTIQALPGIQSINETVSDINVRGGTNDQNLITWNGIKMYQSGHFFGLISAFNPYLTDHVLLIKNGTGAYLGDGVSSSILIKTDNKVTKEFSGSGGVNMIYGDLYTKIPITEKVSLQLSSRRSITDYIRTPTYDKFFERIFTNTEVAEFSNGNDKLLQANEDFYFYDFSGKLLYDISEKDKLRVNFLNIYNEIEYQESAVIANQVIYRNSSLDQHSTAIGISFEKLWSDKFKSSAEGYYTFYSLDALNQEILKDQRLIQGNEVLEFGSKVHFRNRLSNTFDLFSGYQFTETGVTNLEDINNPDFRRVIKEVMHTHAIFLEGTYTSTSEKTFIQGGIRTNYYNKINDFSIEPRLSFHQRLYNYFNLEILGEFKSQATSQVIDFQNDFLGVEKRRWVLSNNIDVPLIKSKQLSAGINYDREKFLISVEAYTKEVNGITSSSQGFVNQFQFTRSTGGYTSSGIDLLITKKFFNQLNTWVSYSYSENTYTFKEFDPSEFPNNLDVRHLLTFGSSFKRKNLEISTGLNWHTGKPFTQAVSAEGPTNRSIIYELPNSSRLDDYLRVDISAKYNFKLTKKMTGQVGASVWNLLGYENIINRYYRVGTENSLIQVDEYSLDSTPNVVLRINF